jgi:hypothetical protein
MNEYQPLTKRAYMNFADEDDSDAPSHALIAKRFGSWRNALERAHLPKTETHLDYSWAHTRDEALSNMTRFVLETGKTSAGEYRRWSEDEPGVLRVPQAILGERKTWTDAIAQVFEALKRGSTRDEYQRMLFGLAKQQALALSEKFSPDVDFAPHAPVPAPSANDPLPGEE